MMEVLSFKCVYVSPLGETPVNCDCIRTTMWALGPLHFAKDCVYWTTGGIRRHSTVRDCRASFSRKGKLVENWNRVVPRHAIDREKPPGWAWGRDRQALLSRTYPPIKSTFFMPNYSESFNDSKSLFADRDIVQCTLA
jgi:hypothetical protein